MSSKVRDLEKVLFEKRRKLLLSFLTIGMLVLMALACGGGNSGGTSDVDVDADGGDASDAGALVAEGGAPVDGAYLIVDISDGLSTSSYSYSETSSVPSDLLTNSAYKSTKIGAVPKKRILKMRWLEANKKLNTKQSHGKKAPFRLVLSKIA